MLRNWRSMDDVRLQMGFPARAYLRLGRVAPGGSEARGAEGLSLEGGPQGGGAEAHSGGHCKSWYLRLRDGRGGFEYEVEGGRLKSRSVGTSSKKKRSRKEVACSRRIDRGPATALQLSTFFAGLACTASTAQHQPSTITVRQKEHYPSQRGIQCWRAWYIVAWDRVFPARPSVRPASEQLS